MKVLILAHNQKKPKSKSLQLRVYANNDYINLCTQHSSGLKTYVTK